MATITSYHPNHVKTHTVSKRKLTRRQAWRIEKIQRERVARAEQRARRADRQLTEGELGTEQAGRVIAHFGTQVDVEYLEGPEQGIIQRCHLRANLGSLVTGDRVIWRPGQPTGVIVAALPRDSALSRPDSQGQLKPVAANIDRIVIVIAPLPVPHANLIDRYLVAAEAVGIQALILLNKTDLLADAPAGDIEQLLAGYPALGYPVLRASTRSRDGLSSLRQALAGRTSVFVGQSGVGKSSLINALLPGVDLRVGELSRGKAKGTHTTTSARLFHFPDGGDLVDSPGIREFGLWHMAREEVLAGFVEFRPLIGHCRFRDCRHEGEPDCAIQRAVAEGGISPARLASYQHIVQSLNDSPVYT